MKHTYLLVSTFRGFVALLLVLLSSSQFANAESCLAAFKNDPCGLLTDEMLRSLVKEVPDSVKKAEHKSKRASLCSYSWPSDRKSIVKVAGREIPVPEKNKVSISGIQTYKSNAQDMFRRAYLPTVEEQKNAQEMMAKSFDRQSKKRGLDKQASKIGKGLLSSKLFSTEYVAVEGIGTMASWQSSNSKALNVLDNDTKFTITSNLSAETAEDKAIAESFANAILSTCK